MAALLGNLPPDISITATTPTWGVPRGSVVSFSASATDPDGTTPSVAWFVDGAPTGVTGPTFSTQFFGQSFGLHTVTATASDGRWTVPDRQGGIVVNIVNTAPTVRITSPADGATFVNFHGIPLPCRFFVCPDEITLTAETADTNNNPSRLPDAGVSWFLDGSTTAFATGHNADAGCVEPRLRDPHDHGAGDRRARAQLPGHGDDLDRPADTGLEARDPSRPLLPG